MIKTAWNTAYYQPIQKKAVNKREHTYKPGEIHAFVYALIIEGETRTIEIAKILNKARKHVSTVIADLNQAGYIYRTQCDHDCRFYEWRAK